jgi:hypothetical protein
MFHVSILSHCKMPNTRKVMVRSSSKDATIKHHHPFLFNNGTVRFNFHR